MYFKSLCISNANRFVLAGFVSFLAVPALAQVSGNATLTSDYVWRGSSQTRENPAVQAGIKYSLESGFYASAWGSNVKFRPDNGANSEFDFAAGWAGKISSDLALDVYALRYQYPSADINLNWNELNAALTWRGNYWIAVGHSNNAMASKTTGTYVQIGAKLPLNERLRIEGMAARYMLDSAYVDSYSHGAVSSIWVIKAPIELRVTLHTTDSAAKKLFSEMAGTRGEVAIQAAF